MKCLRCEKCGGDLKIIPNGKMARCLFCRTVYTIDTMPEEKKESPNENPVCANKEITVTKTKAGKYRYVYLRREACMNGIHVLDDNIPIIIFDLETTGVSKINDLPIQIAAFKMKKNAAGQYDIVDQMDELIKPAFPVPEEASAVNNITNEMLEDKPTEEQIFDKISAFFDEEFVACGYNVGFDIDFMKAMYTRQSTTKKFDPCNVVDVKAIAEEVVDRYSLTDDSFKQGNVAELYNVSMEGLHNAYVDIQVTGRLLFTLLKHYQEEIREPDSLWETLPKINISAMYPMKKSKESNFIMVNVNAVINGVQKTGVLRYDIYNKRYLEDDGVFMNSCDMKQFAEDADMYAGGSIRKYNSAKRKRRK